MDDAERLFLESIDRRTAALREDVQVNQNVIRAALEVQQKDHSEALQKVLLTVQDINSNMVRTTDCGKCQQNFVTKKEIRTIVAVLVAVVSIAEWMLSRGGDLIEWLKTS